MKIYSILKHQTSQKRFKDTSVYLFYVENAFESHFKVVVSVG